MTTATTRTPLDRSPDWHTGLAEAIRCPEALIRRLELPRTLLPAARRAARDFPLMVTESFLSRIRPGDPHDPLLKQILPVGSECEDHSGFTRDAVGDGAARVAASHFSGASDEQSAKSFMPSLPPTLPDV